MLSINELSKITGLSKRTIRFYEENGLIKSERLANNYRVYDEQVLDQLQTIMFFKYFDFKLAQIKEIVKLPRSAQTEMLANQREKLLLKQQQLAAVISTLDQTIMQNNGGKKMTQDEKFAAFKAEKIAQNEAEFGTEIREKYGDDTVDKSNQHFGNLTKEQMQDIDDANETLKINLQKIIAGDQSDEIAENAFHAHQKFLKTTMPNYSSELHRSITAMYVADQRFAKYYQNLVGDEKAAEILNQIVQKYAKHAE